MKCHVLDEDRWQRFLDDTLTPADANEISRHLETDCSDCDQFIANLSDAAELGLLRIRQDLVDEVHSNEIAAHEITGKQHPMTDVPPTSKWIEGIFGDGLGMPAFAGAMIALFLITGGIVPQLYLGSADVLDIEQMLFQKEKGIAAAASTIDMKFTAGRRGADGKLEFLQGVNGETYQQNDLLFLKYGIATSGHVYVLALHNDEQIDVLYPDASASGQLQSTGEHTVPDDQEIMGYPLAGLAGRYMVIGIYSAQPLDIDKQVIPFVRQSAKISEGRIDHADSSLLGKNIAIDTIYFDIGV